MKYGAEYKKLLSDEIYYSDKIQEYLKEVGKPWGYIGHENRTKFTDECINNLFKGNYKNFEVKVPLSETLILEWICSRPARHFMDMCGHGDPFDYDEDPEDIEDVEYDSDFASSYFMCHLVENIIKSEKYLF